MEEQRSYPWERSEVVESVNKGVQSTFNTRNMEIEFAHTSLLTKIVLGILVISFIIWWSMFGFPTTVMW